MKATLLFVVFSIAMLVGNMADAQTSKVYINQQGQVITTEGSIPANSYYIDEAGHLKKMGSSGLYYFDGSSIATVNQSSGSEEPSNRASSKSTSESVNQYYIGEDMKLHKLEGEYPNKSFYNNEYGKLLENKGKKKPNNASN